MPTETDIISSAATSNEAMHQIPLRAVVEAYILNELDTSEHPAYGAFRQVAHAISGRPQPNVSISTPLLFTPEPSAVEESLDDDIIPL